MFRTIRRKRAAAMIVGILFVGIPVIISLIFSSKTRTDVSGPLIQGQPVSHWIRTLPQEADIGFVDYNHPLEKAGPEIIPALIRALESDGDRHAFYRKLLRVVPPPLSRRLSPPDAPMHRIKSFAAFRLGQFGPLASNAVPALARIVTTNSFASGRAIQALGNIGSASEPALAAIAGAFKNPQVVESWPTTALLQIGKIPPEVIGYLETQACSTQGHVAGPAVVALWLAKRDSESLERVHAFLESTNASFRAHTAVSLRHHDEVPLQTKQTLRALLRDAGQGVAQAAAVALSRAHDEPTALLPILIGGLKGGQFSIPCAQALAEIGPLAREALPELEKHMETRSPALCRAFLQAIKSISYTGNAGDKQSVDPRRE